jgi:RHS repeat-associated protein
MREESGVAPGLISLPSGGGGISPLGERFQPDLVRGSGSYAVPLQCPKGPSELRPTLAVTYSTGAGNGPYGLGWRLNISRIERATDRGLPTYTDYDTFSIGEADNLVDIGGGRYRPASDNRFWLIERMGESWRIQLGDGRTMLFGQTSGSREEDAGRVFAWYLDVEIDPAGNRIEYRYRRDGARLYIDEIEYSVWSLKFQYEARPDVLRNGRAGFLRTTAQRLRAVELRCSRIVPTLMRTYSFAYGQARNGTSLLAAVGLSGMRDGETASFPQLTFEYSELDLSAWNVEELQALIPPPALDEANTQLVDMTGDGLPDVLAGFGQRMLLWLNRGDGWLDGPQAIDGIPSTLALDRPNVALADLTGKGRADLFATDQPLSVVFENDGRGGFDPQPVVFANQPTLRLAEADTRLMDIDGDGVTDLIRTGSTAFLLFRHDPALGWQDPQAISRVADLEQFPDVSFADQGVLLADMTGDGLQDFVVVQSGSVRYWPFLGRGAWATQVEMESPPAFPDGFRRDRLHVLDLDGDGCSDVVYFDYDRTLIWLNQSGVRFAPPIEIPVTPPATSTQILAADFLGDGRPGFAWSSSPGVEDSAGYRYLRFDGGRAPYLLNGIDNGIGGRTEISYSTTTAMRIADRTDGREWPGQLPFPVHVVSAIAEKDTVANRADTRAFHYHDGVYDGPRREFRGFSGVTVNINGDESVPATRQEFEYFQGAPEAIDLIARDRQRAIAGALVATRIYESTATGLVLREHSTQTWDARLEFSGPRASVFFPFLTSIETREPARQGLAPDRVERSRYSNYDEHGNPGSRSRESFADGEPTAQWIRSEEINTFTGNTIDWIVKLPVRTELRDAAGIPFAIRIAYYDGAPFAGLAEGQVTRGLSTRIEELRVLDARTPADYIGARDLSTLGYHRAGVGDTVGWYADASSLRRDAFGNIVEQKDALGVSAAITYDADAVFPATATDALGRTTTAVFDPRSGEPQSVAYADGRTVRFEHDAAGRLTASFESDDAGTEQLVKRYVLDLASSPVSITTVSPLAGGRAAAEFSLATNFEAVEGAIVSRVYYDGTGSPVLQISTAPDAPGGARRFATAKRSVLNARGLVAAELPPHFIAGLAYFPPPAPDASAARMRYDATGSREETLGPGPIHQRLVRDNFLITHFEGDAAGAFGAPVPAGPASRTERFDARSRLYRIEETDGDGASIVTTYDLTLDGQIEVVRDGAAAEVARYSYAGPGQLVRIDSRDAGRRTYYRDATGRLRERINADGSRIFHAYDLFGRPVQTESAAPGLDARTLLRTFIYDDDPDQPPTGRFLLGRLAVVSELDYTVRYSYNRAGKQTREDITADGATLSTRNEYNLLGRQTATVYPDGRRLDYTLDGAGVTSAIPGVLSNVEYDADGTVLGYLLANGVAVFSPRDPVSRRLTEVAARRGDVTLRRLAYDYDAVGNITAIHDEIGADVQFQSYTYDGLHRLSTYSFHRDNAAGPVLRAGAYAYDDSGSLLAIDEAEPLSLVYGDAARPGRLTQLKSAGGLRPVVYDGRGHTRSFGDLATLDFDPLDRLTRIVKTNGVELRMLYDARNRRIRKQVVQDGTITTIRYAAGLFERQQDRAIRHIFLANTLVASETVPDGGPAATLYYLGDRHGSIVLATDSAGVPIQVQRYTPFGLAQSVGSLDRYLGRIRDAETDLIHLGARYYAPAIGRFISPDWYILEDPRKPARIPQSFNVYSYAINNPLVFRDPSGMWFFIALIVAFVVGFVAGTVYGLAKGQGWGSLLTGLETGLTAAIGFSLGAGAGALLGSALGGVGLTGLGTTLAGVGGAMGGLNGLLSGARAIYDWEHPSGYLAFLADSTWGLLGTSLGNVVQICNIIGGAKFRDDLSHSQNRNVYENGIYIAKDDAFTQGNVISNAVAGGKTINMNLINNHESLHILQNRIFGPIFQAVYVAWMVGGFVVGSIFWLFHTDHSYGDIIETATYFDNPWEYWAYKHQGYWQPKGQKGFDPIIAWG